MTEAPVQQTDAPLAEDAGRKRAEAIIKKAIYSSGIPLQTLGVDHRLLPGLWMATVNILIACLDVEDIMRLLTSRAHSLPLVSDNANAPPISMTKAQANAYAAEVTEAARAISKLVEEAIPALEKEGLEDRLPEAMLDCATLLLASGWGPTHLKRAMIEQVSVLLRGNVAPAVFMEPSEFLVKKEVPAEELSTEPEEEPETVAAERAEKSVRARIECRADGDMARWAATIHKAASDGMEEIHLLSGRIADKAGRAAPLKGVIETLKALSHENAMTDIVVEMEDESVMRGMFGDDDLRHAHRMASEADLWREFDLLAAERHLRFKASPSNLQDFIHEACDRVLRAGVRAAS